MANQFHMGEGQRFEERTSKMEDRTERAEAESSRGTTAILLKQQEPWQVYKGQRFEEPSSMIDDRVAEPEVGPSRITTAALPKERGPWQVYNLLTLDGGGVRGYWTLLVLSHLMQLIAALEENYDDPIHDQMPAFQSFDPQQYPTHCCHIPRSDGERRIPPDVDHNDRDHDIRNLARSKRFLPCHYFDYIGGTSTGGLIAIMLGRLRMTVADCLKEYKTLGAEIFGKPRMLHQLRFPFVKRTKYDALRLHTVFSDVVERRREDGGNAQLPVDRLPSRDLICRTFVTSYATFPDTPGVTAEHVLRSYNYAERDPSRRATHSQPPVRRYTNHGQQVANRQQAQQRSERVPRRTINRGPPANLAIPEVARAATAAPFYFDPLKVRLNDREGVLFEDGGFGATNNPTMVGIEEIQCMHGRNFLGTVVSVGTARGQKAETKERQLKESIQKKLRRVINMATDPDSEHRRATTITRDQRVEYFRLNPQQDGYRLAIPLDEWLPRSKKRPGLFEKSKNMSPGQRTMEEMDRLFNAWALDHDTQAHMIRCAEALVDCRRERTRDLAKWERYALGSAFRCQLANIHHECDHDFVYRNEFEDHLRTHHELTREAIRREANAAMLKFTYQAARTGDGGA